jgi:glutathione peroxidase
MSTVHNFIATTLEGRDKPLSDFAGHVLLVVNTTDTLGKQCNISSTDRCERDC